MNRVERLCAALLLASSISSPALAWNDKGHMMVAFLAYQQLNQATRARVAVLLELNPQFNSWKQMIPAGTPTADRPALIFAIAATWPDFIKGHGNFKDDGTHDGNRPDGPSSSLNDGYSDKLRHKYWHFVDEPFTRDGTPLPALPEPNVESRIHLFRTVLSTPGMAQDDPLKSYDLVWLLHLIGDVHQPLHAAARVRAAQPEGDDGGNLVTVCAKPPCGGSGPTVTRLHSFWDGLFGQERDVASAVAAAAQIQPAPAAKAAILDEHQWVIESFDLAQGEVYRPPVGPAAGPFSLNATYRNGARALARKQVALAAARLANVLNADLK
jgi:hypothetical protein